MLDRTLFDSTDGTDQTKLMPQPIKILLVEDDELFRLGLVVRLQQEVEMIIVAEAEDGETAVALTQRHHLDLVLLDIGLPRMSGIEACRQIRQQQPNLPILVLTSHSDQTLITRLISVGVQGYCLKGIGAETLFLAIRSVVAGASWWDRTATQEIQTVFSQPIDQDQQVSPEATLTERELEILSLMAAGKTNPEIAQMLYIATGTVRVHVHAILHKLGVNESGGGGKPSRDRAIAIAKEKRWISS